MKSTEEVVRGVVHQGVSIICALLLVLIPFNLPALAQDSAPAQPEASEPAVQPFTPDQLDNLVAPIALYPDALLSQVLVASTYPLEIVEASQWLQQNRNLQGQQLLNAARQQNWDPSIQALVAFPDVLGRLASNADWTSDLGNAFLAQQAAVMNAVQRMRAQAQASGKLTSDSEQTVVAQSQGGRTVIEIVPANPQVIYVPQYNPEYIWGPPDWGYYPPLYYPAVGFGFGFGSGIFLGSYFGGWAGWGAGGWGGWGWGPNWFNCSVIQNSFFFNHYGFRGYGGGFGRSGIWAHNPYHRLGVPYSNRGLATRYGGNFTGRGGVVRSGLGGPRGAAFGGGRLQGNAQSFGSRGASAAGGWRRFGSPGASIGQRGLQQSPQVRGNAQSFGSRGANAGGWSRFGSPGASIGQRGAQQSPQVRGNAQSFGSRGANAAGGWSRFGSTNANVGQRGGAFNGSRMQSPQVRGNAQSFGNRAVGRSTPSYSRSAPSFRQSPSFGGAARSSASFGGARSFGGSRPSSGGGGGSRSFGGGHSGGGSHGGGGHGGRR